jgi:hypothetical protein
MENISWSPKIRQAKIRQLYQNDARGAVDEVIVEDVGLVCWTAAIASGWSRVAKWNVRVAGRRFRSVSQTRGKHCRAYNAARCPAAAGKRQQTSGMSPGSTGSCSARQPWMPSRPICMTIRAQAKRRSGWCVSTSSSTHSLSACGQARQRAHLPIT